MLNIIDELVIKYNLLPFLNLNDLYRLNLTDRFFHNLCVSEIKKNPKHIFNIDRQFHIKIFLLYSPYYIKKRMNLK